MKNDWITKILLSIIFLVIGYAVHREIERLDTTVRVLHQRVSANVASKADKDDMQREFNHVWKKFKEIAR